MGWKLKNQLKVSQLSQEKREDCQDASTCPFNCFELSSAPVQYQFACGNHQDTFCKVTYLSVVPILYSHYLGTYWAFTEFSVDLLHILYTELHIVSLTAHNLSKSPFLPWYPSFTHLLHGCCVFLQSNGHPQYLSNYLFLDSLELKDFLICYFEWWFWSFICLSLD